MIGDLRVGCESHAGVGRNEGGRGKRISPPAWNKKLHNIIGVGDERETERDAGEERHLHSLWQLYLHKSNKSLLFF